MKYTVVQPKRVWFWDDPEYQTTLKSEDGLHEIWLNQSNGLWELLPAEFEEDEKPMFTHFVLNVVVLHADTMGKE